MARSETAIVLIRCADRKGIVAGVSQFLFSRDANIIAADQYSTDPENGRFFMRLEFYFDCDRLPPAQLEALFGALMRELGAQWEIYYASSRMRVGILVSQYDHCLFDILYRVRSGEFGVEIPAVIGNHERVRSLAEQFGASFHYLPVGPGQEEKILQIVKNTTDVLVLARYMQVLSPSFLAGYGRDIINIHHSFLPSFKGSNPYQQAFDRGVKVIGATAHFVTDNLDEGPIIEQAVQRVSHKDNVDSLRRKGRNLEKQALANALHAYIEHRIIRFSNKTIVFE